jgi:hypothetical protein
MALDLRPFADTGLDEPLLRHLIADHATRIAPDLDRLWSYYRNPIDGRIGERTDSSRGYELAQERGLPPRIRRTPRNPATDDRASSSRPDPVIENDIAWRIDALVAFLFGKPITIRSTADDPALRARIERSLEAVFESSGGMNLLQDAALLGAVHGWVDLVLRAEHLIDAGWQLGARTSTLSDGDLAEIARLARIEIVEAPRAIPLLAEHDYRRIDAYIIHAVRETRAVQSPHTPAHRASLARWIPAPRTQRNTTRSTATVIEILSAHHRQLSIDDTIAEDHPNRLGILPIVHIQNTSQPFRYAGISEVEPLIPLQDELNTRLSDRAHRVTMQSFNMYLAKGLDALAGATGAPMRIAPGQVWSTDNPEADVKAFGGDGHSPSEERHIDEVREAMDKLSAVSPVVLGVVRAKLGHLSSVNALRITMLGVLSKTERKRLAYARAIADLARLILRALDIAGLLRTTDADRGIRIEWPDPLPASEDDRLAAARLKRDIGIPPERILAELGYAPRNDAVD